MARSILVCPDCKEPVVSRQSRPSAWMPDGRYKCVNCKKVVSPNALESSRSMTIASGAPLGGQSGVLPIGRTALGTGTGVTTGTAFDVKANVRVAAGSTLVVFLHYEPSAGPVDGMTWNGIAMSKPASIADGNAINTLDAWVLENCPGGVGTVVVDATSATSIAYWDATLIEVTNAAAASIDRTRTGQGVNTAPATAGILATRQSSELVLAAVGWETQPISGAWGNNFLAGQNASAGATASLEDGFKFVSSVGQYNLSKTGATNAGWATIILTLRQA